MDLLVGELGITPNEHCALGRVRAQPSDVDKKEFEVSIWQAFAQCFLSYEEAVKAIEDFNLGIPA